MRDDEIDAIIYQNALVTALVKEGRDEVLTLDEVNHLRNLRSVLTKNEVTVTVKGFDLNSFLGVFSGRRTIDFNNFKQLYLDVKNVLSNHESKYFNDLFYAPIIQNVCDELTSD